MKLRRALIFVSVAAVMVFAPLISLAAQTNPTVQIQPSTGQGGPPTALPTQTAGSYFENLYRWLLAFVGLAALFALVYGGVLYIFSGAIESTAAAKRWITNAFIGLLIAGGSYVLLRTINPDLVRKFDIQSIIEKRLP